MVPNATILQLTNLLLKYWLVVKCNYIATYATILQQFCMQLCNYATNCNYATCNLCNFNNFMELMQLYATLCNFDATYATNATYAMFFFPATICNLCRLPDTFKATKAMEKHGQHKLMFDTVATEEDLKLGYKHGFKSVIEYRKILGQTPISPAMQVNQMNKETTIVCL
jgi:hypothetical protein